MIAIGLPHGEQQDDEDSLNRERDGNGDNGPTDTLELLYQRLKDGDEVASHSAMGIARCIQEMAHQAARGDKSGLKHWYQKCCDLIAHVDGKDEEDDNGQ
jgi:hypothetical protein